MAHIKLENTHFKDTKKATVAHFKDMLSSNEQWAMRGLIRLYKEQTSEEQVCYHTKDQNSKGFNKVDSEVLTAFAKIANEGRRLSNAQISLLYKRMPKYAEQLYKLSTNQL